MFGREADVARGEIVVELFRGLGADDDAHDGLPVQEPGDRDAGDGMTVTVGRVRDEPALHGVKYVVLSHNTKLGAGKGAVLLAEWLTREGYIGGAS